MKFILGYFKIVLQFLSPHNGLSASHEFQEAMYRTIYFLSTLLCQPHNNLYI